jgi:hypothetical protein
MFIWCYQYFHQGGDCEIMCDEKLVYIEIAFTLGDVHLYLSFTVVVA